MKKITSIIAILLLMSILSINVWAYDNPRPFFDQNKKQAAMGDPFVMKYNGTYYCYVSGGYCFRSTDMVKWTAVGNVYTGAHSDNLFATVRFILYPLLMEQPIIFSKATVLKVLLPL